MTTADERPARWMDYLPLDELVPAERNGKHHHDDIGHSIRRFGFVETPVIDERTGRLVAGHGRRDDLLAKRAAGEPPPEGVAIDGEGRWLVPVQRGWASSDDGEAEAYLIASNQTTIAGGWDDLDAHLTALREMEVDLSGLGLPDPDMIHVDAHDRQPAEPREPDEVQQRVTYGDVWQLGAHRLMCGDCRMMTEPPSCDAVVTDPPYGMRLDASWMGGPAGGPSKFQKDGPVAWDQEAFDPYPFVDWSSDVAMFGADYYYERLPGGGTWWVWDKRSSSEDDFVEMTTGLAYEMVWIKGKRAHRIIRHLWGGIVKQAGSPSDERSTAHPTQKPVAVMEQIIDYLTVSGAVVCDPFAGVGSTLLACDRRGRSCVAIERDPGYCDVILDRWERHGGTPPTKVG